MSYDSKQLSSDDVANGNATLRVWIDVNGDDIIDDQLMYEPYYNGFDGTSMTDWQTWAVNNSTGNFWSNYANSYNGKGGVGGGGGYPTNFTIGDVVADYPAAKIIGVSFSMGTYNDFQVVNVDNFVIETSSAMTTYDFESEEIAPAANGGGGGGAARSVSRSSGEVAGASTSNEEGEVLGDSISIKDALQNFCTPEYINNGEYMYPGVPAPLRAVLKLQMFLKLMEMINVDITGLYDAQTVAAVNMFQTKYAADILTPWNLTAPTGYVYLSTARKINELVCNEEEPSLDNLTPDPNVRNNSVN